MDNKLLEVAMSTRGLLLSKPHDQPHYPLLNSSKINGVERESCAVSKNQAGFGPKLIEIIKHKLTYGSKILPLGRGGKIFEKSFITRDNERLLHASRCCIYTTAGAIAGILFISNERVGFCSDRSIKTYSTTGKLLKFQYKVSIPLKKIDGVGESTDLKKRSNKYMELVTVDDFNFWFLGFPNYKKTVECLRRTINHDCLKQWSFKYGFHFYNKYNSWPQNMDNKVPEVSMCIPTISTVGLLLSKPHQPHYLTCSKTNSCEERESFAASKNHAGFGPKLIEIIKHKLTYGSKILPLGRGGKIFEKRFTIRDGERLLHASRCYIYTTAGAIAGILFISNERVGFCSDRSIKTYSTTGKLLKFQYKVSIPLKKIDGVGESTDLKKRSNKYMELVTVDDFNFWFLGFPNYKKTVECLRQTINHDCLSD
ncbi:hypothetical protein M8C21_000587 [Ambrosia artemisiifolia]|uniref:GRAM domain-containing protein n=1 Tax=Ambrosia artemisiifolia TaxID=4212 RepID=A0AAD5CH85_AMBAR|nr:hypothetical protein M8C21_000587 [Ambrosia artemisiifolia]